MPQRDSAKVLPTLDDIAAERARRRLHPFVKQCWKIAEAGEFQDNWHIGLICEYLEAVSLGQILRLIINVPPQTLKSTLATVDWPTWDWLRNPQRRFICSSYAASLSVYHSVKRRNIIESAWYQENYGHIFALASDQNVKHEFSNNKSGHMVATSVEGTATGKAADIVLMDDLLSAQMARSDAARASAKRHIDETLIGRLSDQTIGAMIMVMQRLHRDDPTAHLLGKKLEHQKWEIIKIQAEAKRKTVYSLPISGGEIVRETGSLLNEKRLPKTVLSDLSIDMRGGFDAQFQQEPRSEGGDAIKLEWFPRYKRPTDAPVRVVHSWDTASKKQDLRPSRRNKPPAFSVCIVFYETKTSVQLVHVIRRRMEYPELKRCAIDLAVDYPPDEILIEDKSSGISLIQDLKADTSLPVIGIQPEGDKLARMDEGAGEIEAGRVELPEDGQCNWLEDFKTDIGDYPDPEFWDEIDALSQFLKRWKARRRKGEAQPPMSLKRASSFKGKG